MRTAHIHHQLVDHPAMSEAAAGGVVAGLRDEIAAAAEAEWPGRGLAKAVNRHGTAVVNFRPDRLLAAACLVAALAGAVVIVRMGQASVRRRAGGVAAAAGATPPRATQ